MNNFELKKNGPDYTPINMPKPPCISSIFNWFGKKDKNELVSSLLGKNLFKIKLSSLDLDSLNINSDDIKKLKSTLKTNQNGPRANIFKIPKNQLGMSEGDFISKVVVPNIIKSEKDQIGRGKCVWSTSTLSITSKKNTNKNCNFKTVKRIKSQRSIKSSSSSKTTLKVNYKKSSLLNIIKPTHNGYLKESISPQILKSNIENPVFVPIRCIGKKNAGLNKAPNEPNGIDQDTLKDLESKTKVIPVLMKKIESMEDQLINISSATKKINEAVSQQHVLFNNKEQTKTPRSQSQKLIRTIAARKKKQHVNAKHMKPRRSLASTSLFNSASEPNKNFNFIFEPKTRALGSFTVENEKTKPTHSQILSQEFKLKDESGERLKMLFDKYPSADCDTILQIYQELELSNNNSTMPKQEIGSRNHQIELNEVNQNIQFGSFLKNVGLGTFPDGKDIHEFLQLYMFPSENDCEVIDLTNKTGSITKSSIDFSVPNNVIVNPSLCSMHKAKLNKNVLIDNDVSKAAIFNTSLETQDESYSKCGCRLTFPNKELNDKIIETRSNDKKNFVMKDSIDDIINKPSNKMTESLQSFGDCRSCKNLQNTAPEELSLCKTDDGNGDTKKHENVCDMQPENIFGWLQSACSNRENKPEVSITIKVKDENKCLILESLRPKLLEANEPEKLLDENLKETDDSCMSEKSEPKVHTRSILTTSEGVHYDKDPSGLFVTPLPVYQECSNTIDSTYDTPLRNTKLNNNYQQLNSLGNNSEPETNFEFESAGRGDVNLIPTKVCCSLVEENRIDQGEKYAVMNGKWEYLDRKKRAIFDDQIRSKTSITIIHNPASTMSVLQNLIVNNGVGDAVLSSFDSNHYRLDSCTVNNDYPVRMRIGDSNVTKFQDNLLQINKQHDYDLLRGSTPNKKPGVELAVPKLTHSPSFFRCIGNDIDVLIESDKDVEKSKKIKMDSKRGPRRCSVTFLQDIEEVLEESEEEVEDTVETYKHEFHINIGTPANENPQRYTEGVAESPVVSDVGTHKSSVSVQTDWSLIGITIDHFRSSTFLAERDQSSVGCQTEEIVNDKKLYLPNSLLSGSNSSKICAAPSRTNLSHLCLHSVNSGEDSEINVAEFFLNVVQSNIEQENKIKELKIAETLENLNNIKTLRECVSIVPSNDFPLKTTLHDVRTYGFQTSSSSPGYKLDTKHVCSHPCFPFFSDESINSNDGNLGPDVIVPPSTYSILPDDSLMNRDVAVSNNERSNFNHLFVFSGDVNSPIKTNSFSKESSFPKFRIISNGGTLPQAINNTDEFKYESLDYSSTTEFKNVNFVVDTTPVASVGEIGNATKSEATAIEENGANFRQILKHQSFVVNYLYEIKYDVLDDIVSYH